jgi:hypothetical protein
MKTPRISSEEMDTPSRAAR